MSALVTSKAVDKPLITIVSSTKEPIRVAYEDSRVADTCSYASAFKK
jgi:hypothetical protein